METTNTENQASLKKEKISKNAVLSSSKLLKFNEAEELRGVIYISRIPPFMKPEKLRHLLSQHGKIHRIYLVPEDKSQRQKRIKQGGNRKINFTEGWVEFEDKNIAKKVVKALNGTLLGGKKRSFYHDDMWNLKYLKKFKWSHLTEKLAYEKRIKEQKLRLEIAQSAKENSIYLDRVDQAKKLEKMEDRKLSKKRSVSEMQSTNTTKDIPDHIRRRFKQREPAIQKD